MLTVMEFQKRIEVPAQKKDELSNQCFECGGRDEMMEEVENRRKCTGDTRPLPAPYFHRSPTLTRSTWTSQNVTHTSASLAPTERSESIGDHGREDGWDYWSSYSGP